MKADGLLRVDLFNGFLNGNQVCHPPSAYFILLHKCNALLSREIVDHLLIDQRDDNLIATNNSLIRSSSKRKRVCTRSVYSLVIH